MDEAQKLRTTIKESSVARSFDLAFKGRSTLQIAHSKSALNLDNLESLFGAFEMMSLLDRPIGALSTDEVRRLSDAIKGMAGDIFRYDISRYLKRNLSCCGEMTGPMIVPPTWSKLEHHRKIQPVWSAAAKHLSEARNIVVIGYSLPESDMFFRDLYAVGTIGEELIQNFVLVDPSEQVSARFRELLSPAAQRRYSIIPVRFEEAISRIVAALQP